MNASQLQLVDVAEKTLKVISPAPAEKPLTVKQQFVLTLVTEAGWDGIHADEAGAAWCSQNGKHPFTTRCDFDGQSGNQVLRALRNRGLVRYRRGKDALAGAWIIPEHAGKPAPRPDPVGYGEFPPGF